METKCCYTLRAGLRALAVLVGGLAGAALPAQEHPPATVIAPLNRLELNAGYLPILDHLPLLVSHARDSGGFQHITVTPKLFKSWDEMQGALKAGVINAAFILSPLAMDLFRNGQNIRAILLAHRDGAAITVRTGADIHSAADLRGKAIAIPARNATHTALLDKYLRTAGLTLKDVTTKIIAPPHMLLAMKHQRIDAFIVAEPFGVAAQKSGLGELLVLSREILENHVDCIVVVKAELIHQFPLALQEWVDSLIRAGRFIDEDKLANQSREVAAITTKTYFNHNAESVQAGLQHPADRISFSDLNPNAVDIQAIADMANTAGLLPAMAVAPFVAPEFYRTFMQSSSPKQE